MQLAETSYSICRAFSFVMPFIRTSTRLLGSSLLLPGILAEVKKVTPDFTKLNHLLGWVHLWAIRMVCIGAECTLVKLDLSSNTSS